VVNHNPSLWSVNAIKLFYFTDFVEQHPVLNPLWAGAFVGLFTYSDSDPSNTFFGVVAKVSRLASPIIHSDDSIADRVPVPVSDPKIALLIDLNYIWTAQEALLDILGVIPMRATGDDVFGSTIHSGFYTGEQANISLYVHCLTKINITQACSDDF
jgi:hypothetical protein